MWLAVGGGCFEGGWNFVMAADEYPDIRTVAADLQVPEIVEDVPAAGRRVRQTLADWQQTDVYHVLFLPQNWTPHARKYPVLVEWAGNGGYANAWGDTCSGRPEGCKLGYGLSAGQDFIWLCLPYLNGTGDQLALKWWGDAPDYDPQPTLKYCRAAVAEVCRKYGGDAGRVVLCGFSRGALACNYLGLHDDQTSALWCGFFAYSHYDGVRQWPYPGSDAVAAERRLQRLGQRPQFICSEASATEAVQAWLQSRTNVQNLTFASTGFRNHNDGWILRPSPARTAARNWLHRIVDSKSVE